MDSSQPLPCISVVVIESMYSVSGIVLSVLESKAGMLSVDVIIQSADGLQWRVAERNVLLGRRDDVSLKKLMADNDYFLYRLDPIGHSKRPEVNAVLQIAG